MAKNFKRWLLFVSAIQIKKKKSLADEFEFVMTYRWVFKYLPQVIVVMRSVIIGRGNEPPKVVTVGYVHEDSLQ